MDSHKLIVKFFAADHSGVAQHEFVPVFHGLIQARAVPDHLLIDVSDYAHVHHGPGILLAAHEGNFSSDTGEGRLGLLYQRKQPVAGAGDLRGRLAYVFAAALRVCDILQRDAAFEGRLHFRTDEVVIRVNDRLLAPNTPDTYREVEPALRSFLAELYPGDDVRLEPRHSALTLFETRSKAGSSPPVSDLLERLEALTPSPAAQAPSR